MATMAEPTHNLPKEASITAQATSPASIPTPNYLANSSAQPISPESPQAPTQADDNSQKENDDEKEAKSPPPWADMKTKAGKDRKRLPLACIACRRKKIRCSGEKPACKHCLKSRIPCVYKVTTRKAAPRTDYMAMLDKRLKRMEDRVLKIIPKDNQPHIPRAILKPSAVAANQHKQRPRKRTLDDAFGSDLENPAGTNGTTTPKNEGKKAAAPKADDQEENSLLTEGAEHLPSFAIQEHLCEVYYDHVYGQAYCLLHKPSFMRRFRASKLPPVLLLTVCAISARFSDHPELRTDPPFLRGEHWARTAREIALRRYDSPNIVILTCLILLSLHEFGSCQGGRSWMLAGMAHRMAYALQLHKDLNYDPMGQRHGRTVVELSKTDREIRRRTMWACFTLDRFNSSGTARPMFVNEKLLDLQLPLREDLFQMEIPGPTETLQGKVPNPVLPNQGLSSDVQSNMGVAAYTIRLVSLWGRFINYFNLGGRLDDVTPMWRPESDFNALKNEIKNFRTSLPSNLQYNSENLQTHAADNVANQFLYMHILFNQVMLFSHRFAFPASADFKLPKETPIEFISEARKTALDAARAISSLIDEAMNHRTYVPFAGYCAFLSATVHINCIFSKNAQLESTSKACLAHNIRYLTKMKKFWGMFHYMMQILKDLYKQQADAAAKGTATPDMKPALEGNFQYGDWFEKYPRGVSQTDFQEPANDSKKEAGNDAAMSEKNDLKSAEEFFATMSPPSAVAANARAKARKRQAKGKASGSEQKQAIPHNKTSSQTSGQPDAKQGWNSQQMDVQNASTAMQPVLNYAGSQNPAQLQQQIQSRQSLQMPQTQVDLDAMGNFNSPILGQMASMQSNNSSMLAQLDRQLALGPYNSTLIDPSPSVSSSDLQFSGLGGGGDLTGMWDLDLSGFEDEFMAEEPATAWFPPFNLNMPPEFGAAGGMQSLSGAGSGDMPIGGTDADTWLWEAATQVADLGGNGSGGAGGNG